MQRDSGSGAIERLYKAVFLLAADTGLVEQRLAAAYFDYLHEIALTDLPLNVRERFAGICEELHKHFPTRDARTVSRDKAVTLAMEIIMLYDEINSH